MKISIIKSCVSIHSFTEELANSLAIFETISGLTEADISRAGLAEIIQIQKTSNIRFYCDNDEPKPKGRWSLVPDNQCQLPYPVPNKNRKSEDQEWEDTENAILRNPTEPGC